MSYTLVLNASNLVAGNNNNNAFRYNFGPGGFTIGDKSTISVKQIMLPYSWYNISAAIGNNTFTYTIPGSTGVIVTLLDGFYTMDDLNNALKASLFKNNFYFYNTTSDGPANLPPNKIIYPFEFGTNPSQYTNTITFQYIPIDAASVVTQFGPNWVWAKGVYPTNAQLPTINFAANTRNKYSLSSLLGFTRDRNFPAFSTFYYGLSSTFITNVPTLANSAPFIMNGNSFRAYTYFGSISFLSQPTYAPTFPPQGSNVNSVIVRCDQIENNVGYPSDILDSFPITSTFGSNINYLPSVTNAVKLKSGITSSLTVSFSDQDLNPLVLNDPNVLIVLSINSS